MEQDIREKLNDDITEVTRQVVRDLKMLKQEKESYIFDLIWISFGNKKSPILIAQTPI